MSRIEPLRVGATPHGVERPRSAKVSVSIPAELLELIDELAEVQGVKRSPMVARLLLASPRIARALRK